MHAHLPSILLSSCVALVLASSSSAQLSNPVIGAKEARLFAANAQVQEQLGAAVAISDVRAVCGTPLYDAPGQQSSGAARVFLRTNHGWVQEATLLPSDGLADDQCGHAVAIDGDTIVLGAFRDDHAGTGNGNAGSAYVFVRSGATWTQQAKLVGSGVSGADLFGTSVAIDGDTVAVGAPMDELGMPNGTGVVYIFVRSGSTWSEQAAIRPADSISGDYFGHSVSLSGTSLAAGASRDDDLGANSGSAYVFVRSGSTWSQQGKLLASDGEDGDALGWSIAISGDVVAVGAPYYNGAAIGTGVAYAFARAGGVWSQEAILEPVGLGGGQRAGWSIAADGAFALVGVPDDPVPGSTGGGSARLFRRAGTSWSEETKIAHDAARGNLGISVSISGDRVIAGAPFDSLGLPVGGQGSAYVFRLQNTPEIYCTAKTNSKGCQPTINFSGVSSASSAGAFLITAQNVINNKLGYLMYGYTMENNAFQGGVLCIASPILRSPVLTSSGNPPPDDCSGSFSFDFNDLIQGGSNPALVAGADVFAEWWSRDPALGTSSPVSLSNAIHFAIQP
jgi:FG-GAP repeat